MYSGSKGIDASDVNIITNSIYNGQGFQTVVDYQKFLETAKNIEDFPVNYIDIFLQTKDRSLLTEIGKSRFLAKKIQEAITKSVEPWQREPILRILKLLKHIPFELSNLIDNDLGHAIKSIKKTAIAVNDKLITDEATNLIKEWKELQSKQGPTTGKRDGSERSSTSPPATELKKFRLAIQKEPPIKAKAVTDMNFFNPTVGTEPKRYKIRPIYNVDSSPSPSTVEETPVITQPVSTKKSVTFAEKLFEIREYEKNPEEWTSFDNYNENEIDKYDTEQSPHYNVPTVNWYLPMELNFNTVENPSLVIPKHVRTIESAAQDNREKTALAATYISSLHIPPSPAEPDETPDPNTNTRIIPLEAVNSQPVYNNNTVPISQSAQTPTINPDMITPATLNAAAAIAAAIDPYVTPTTEYHSPVIQPPPTTVQPEISNHTVEAMLRNNPGIMQSLRKLSFLAAGNTGAIQQTLGYQPQMYNNNNNDTNRNQNNRPAKNKNKGGNRGRNGAANRNFSNRICNFYSSAEGCRNGNNCPFAHE